MANGENSPKPVVYDPRLAALGERLDAALPQDQAVSGGKADSRQGNRVLADLIGAIFGSALIGWVIDRFAGTEPWGLVILLFLGIAVAFRNMIAKARSGRLGGNSGGGDADRAGSGGDAERAG